LPYTIQHVASSTAFPYTTLFRSRSGNRLPGTARTCGRPTSDRGGPPAGECSSEPVHPSRTTRRALRRRALLGGARPTAPLPDRRDRKSTRLNSSHQIISYAVFCL